MGLQIGFCYWMGSQPVIRNQVGPQAVPWIWAGLQTGLCSYAGSCPCSTVDWVCSLSFLVRWGLQLYLEVGCRWRVCSMVGWGCFPGFLVMWRHGLCSAIDQALLLDGPVDGALKLPRVTLWSLCSGGVRAYDLPFFRAFGLALCPGGAIGWALQFPSICSQSTWSGRPASC